MKQTSVSYSFTESEIISPDVRLRKDGLPVCDFGKCYGHRTLRFIKCYQTTNQSSSRKLFVESKVQTQISGTEMLIKCRNAHQSAHTSISVVV